MNSDCAFWIGKTHRVCQDYAVAGVGEGTAYAVVSDGCSSSPDTDIGARLLAKAAERLLPDWDPGEAVTRAAVCAERLGLPPTCLDATLLTVWASGETYTAHCYGDGVVVLGHEDGTWDAFVISYAANYPRYPSYLWDPERRERWEAQAGNAKLIQHWRLTADGAREMETVSSDQECETFTGAVADVQFVAVLSDGVQSFARAARTETSRAAQPVAVPDVLTRLLAFKGGQGRFAQRRAQAFLRDGVREGWQHHDDVALGVVWLGDESPVWASARE